ncbi:MAG: zinc ribbon domain-containing protein [Lautropia sp.]|nr:zinc ribbon domain-containing protein [Lautropia sp.]
MPLISCPECNHSVSDQASACPQCGHPIRKFLPAHQANDDWSKAAGMLSAAWEIPKVRVTLTMVAIVAFLLFLFD